MNTLNNEATGTLKAYSSEQIPGDKQPRDYSACLPVSKISARVMEATKTWVKTARRLKSRYAR